MSSLYPYPSGLLHWHWGNHVIATVPVEVTLKDMGKNYQPKPQQNATNHKPFV